MTDRRERLRVLTVMCATLPDLNTTLFADLRAPPAHFLAGIVPLGIGRSLYRIGRKKKCSHNNASRDDVHGFSPKTRGVASRARTDLATRSKRHMAERLRRVISKTPESAHRSLRRPAPLDRAWASLMSGFTPILRTNRLAENRCNDEGARYGRKPRSP
jgi:hypothetical protein